MTGDNTDRPRFKKVALVGVGLIGGSLALKMKAEGIFGSVVGIGRGKENLETALSLGIIDSYTHDLSDGVKDADLIIFAVPVLTTVPLIEKALPFIKDGAIVTDVGSVKGEIVSGVEAALFDMAGKVHFVAGHPIAGTEHSGAASAFPELFIDRKCILTPTASSDQNALSKIGAMWRAAGSEVVEMDTASHDRILGAVSHLPHVIAYALVNAVDRMEAGEGCQEAVISYSAGGFRDFTRIASSSPVMWRHITEMNREAVLHTIDEFRATLDGLYRLIESSDFDKLEAEFSIAKQVRDELVKESARKTTSEDR